ncbi:hypothetical protein [Vibrio phage vB_ValS_PJ32]|nr:hypothetical protein [Vibrio phage vB_ValS_PJ32]
MKIVNPQVLKAISVGKDKVTVTTGGGGSWELSPQDAAKVLDRVTTLPKGRKIDAELMSGNRIIFDTIYKEALETKKEHKQAIEK